MYKTGYSTIEIKNINETEIKIKKDYIDGCIFESIVCQSNSDNSLNFFVLVPPSVYRIIGMH